MPISRTVCHESFLSLALCPVSQWTHPEPHTVYLGRDRLPIGLSLGQFSCFSSSVRQQNRAQNRKSESRLASASPGAWGEMPGNQNLQTDQKGSERECGQGSRQGPVRGNSWASFLLQSGRCAQNVIVDMFPQPMLCSAWLLFGCRRASLFQGQPLLATRRPV